MHSNAIHYCLWHDIHHQNIVTYIFIVAAAASFSSVLKETQVAVNENRRKGKDIYLKLHHFQTHNERCWCVTPFLLIGIPM